MAGNLDTYALPQFKRQIGVTGSVDDATYLLFLQQGVYEADRTLGIGLSVSVDGSDYTVAPDPGDDTESLWNVISWAGVWLYRQKELTDALAAMGGISSVRDEVTSFNRGPVLALLEKMVDKAKSEYDGALMKYSLLADTTAIAIEELGLRESSDDL